MIPVADFTRPDNRDFETIEELGTVTANVDETDEFVDLPVRLCLHYCEPVIEVGPYSLDAAEIEKLRQMLAMVRITERDIDLTECAGEADAPLATVSPIRIVNGEHRP